MGLEGCVGVRWSREGVAVLQVGSLLTGREGAANKAGKE